jgi:hypothetical protein
MREEPVFTGEGEELRQKAVETTIVLPTSLELPINLPAAVGQNGIDEWLEVIPRRFVQEKIHLANAVLGRHEPEWLRCRLSQRGPS